MEQRLNRRQALAGLGSLSLGALLAACDSDDEESGTIAEQATTEAGDGLDGATSCRLTPELTEGPYYFDVDKIRSDIREDREGVALRLAIRVRAETCEPMPNSVVDIWHCDALGSYSRFNEEGTFLRGAQVTNAKGAVEFTTVYPGWYMGRTVHIHAKAHLDNRTVLTTQLFFDDELSTEIHEREPYASHAGRDVFNDGDGIFDDQLVLNATRDGEGYRAAINFDVERA
jgi:protocatechuate 3,4-dioxygenase beta subunit